MKILKYKETKWKVYVIDQSRADNGYRGSSYSEVRYFVTNPVEPTLDNLGMKNLTCTETQNSIFHARLRFMDIFSYKPLLKNGITLLDMEPHVDTSGQVRRILFHMSLPRYVEMMLHIHHTKPSLINVSASGILSGLFMFEKVGKFLHIRPYNQDYDGAVPELEEFTDTSLIKRAIDLEIN